MRKTYRLQSWKAWDKHVDAAARDFKGEFGVAPNLLVASNVTLRRINVAAEKAHVGGTEGGASPTGIYIELDGFSAEDYQLMFIEESEVPENSFSLVHMYESEEEFEAASAV